MIIIRYFVVNIEGSQVAEDFRYMAKGELLKYGLNKKNVTNIQLSFENIKNIHRILYGFIFILMNMPILQIRIDF